MLTIITLIANCFETIVNEFNTIKFLAQFKFKDDIKFKRKKNRKNINPDEFFFTIFFLGEFLIKLHAILLTKMQSNPVKFISLRRKISEFGTISDQRQPRKLTFLNTNFKKT